MRRWVTGLLSAWMIVLLSGAPSLVVQVYAWVRMAQEAGGVENVGEVIFTAPPCEICRIAQRISQDNPDEGETPAPVKRVAFIKLLSTLCGDFTVPGGESNDLDDSFPRISGDRLPGHFSLGPPSPPPRAI